MADFTCPEAPTKIRTLAPLSIAMAFGPMCPVKDAINMFTGYEVPGSRSTSNSMDAGSIFLSLV